VACRLPACRAAGRRRPRLTERGVRRQTLFKISPNLARNVAFGKLEWFQNAPKVATNAQVFAAIAPFGLLVQPCLFRFGPSGACRAAQRAAPRRARLARKRARHAAPLSAARRALQAFL